MNTRCIYYQLDASPSSPSNLTLCPILDFANHTPLDTHIVPLLPSNSPPGVSGNPKFPRPRSKIGGDYIFLSSNSACIETDQEVFLRYGAHSNSKLFVDYGFVNSSPEGSVFNGDTDGEVDVQDILEPVFDQRGATGSWMKSILEEEGYWGYSCSRVHIKDFLANGIYLFCEICF